VGTSHLDRVKEVCRIRVHHFCRNKFIYLSWWKKRWVGWDGGKLFNL